MISTYKIVSFKKRARQEISFVPHKWEQNGILFWPKNNLQLLLSDASSEPQLNWLKYSPCYIKKAGIISYDDALKWEELYASCEDTDAEIGLNISHQPSKDSGERGNEYDQLFSQIPKSLELTTQDNSVSAFPTVVAISETSTPSTVVGSYVENEIEYYTNAQQ